LLLIRPPTYHRLAYSFALQGSATPASNPEWFPGNDTLNAAVKGLLEDILKLMKTDSSGDPRKYGAGDYAGTTFFEHELMQIPMNIEM